MNDGLIDAFGHNAWATQELLTAVTPLSDEQLRTTVPGTFGSILETLWHIISSEASYLTRLSGLEPSWDRSAESEPPIASLVEYARDIEIRWNHFLDHSFDGERAISVHWRTGETRNIPAGIILAQALHHSNEHRAQIATALTTIGGCRTTGHNSPGTLAGTISARTIPPIIDIPG